MILQMPAETDKLPPKANSPTHLSSGLDSVLCFYKLINRDDLLVNMYFFNSEQYMWENKRKNRGVRVSYT